MLGAAGVQIPEDNLDDLHSSREEDGTLEKNYGSRDEGTVLSPVEDNIGCSEAQGGFEPLIVSRTVV
ncbi:hypothetical protein Tco_1165695 [Tanacetum coccineum]